jgi:hypothetical protein
MRNSHLLLSNNHFRLPALEEVPGKKVKFFFYCLPLGIALRKRRVGCKVQTVELGFSFSSVTDPQERLLHTAGSYRPARRHLS